MAENKKPKSNLQIRNRTAEFLVLFYQTGGDGVDVRVQDGTLWLSQKNMGQLFDTSSDNISLHLKNIFNDGELSADSVTEDFSVTAADGKNYKVKHYNLDAIIAVGYRVNSKRATAFRQWATGVLRDYTLRGYVMDRQRMENGGGRQGIGRQSRRADFKRRTGSDLGAVSAQSTSRRSAAGNRAWAVHCQRGTESAWYALWRGLRGRADYVLV
jgi:hypothetical protein